MDRAQAVASVVTAAGVVIGLAITLFFYIDGNKTKLEITISKAGSTPEGARSGERVGITVVNHSKFATTIRSVSIRKADGTVVLIDDSTGGGWAQHSKGTPIRVESRAQIVGFMPNSHFVDATHVIAKTVDGHTKEIPVEFDP